MVVQGGGALSYERGTPVDVGGICPADSSPRAEGNYIFSEGSHPERGRAQHRPGPPSRIQVIVRIGRWILGYLEKGIQTPMARGQSTKIIFIMRWIRTSRLSIKNFLSLIVRTR